MRGKGLAAELAACWGQEVRGAGSVPQVCDGAAVGEPVAPCTMDELLTMGFTDETLNSRVLAETGGDLTRTIRLLVNKERAMTESGNVER